MDIHGNLVPEIQAKGKGRWSPVEPTVDPYVDPKDPGNKNKKNNRRRWYASHVKPITGHKDNSVRQLRVRGEFVEPDGMDELARPYWWLETLQTQAKTKEDRRERRAAGPEPDGYLENGQPYWNVGPDNYWVRKWNEENSAGTDKPAKGAKPTKGAKG
jgi:hypothetical protein